MEIIYQDNHLLVAYKEKGLLSQKDDSLKPDIQSELKEYLKEKYDKKGEVYLGLVHRLDINTSGVMVFARTSKAAARLSEAIQRHEFKKKYYALVEGTMEVGTKGVFEDYLEKDENLRKSFVSTKGKKAILNYMVVKNCVFQGINCSIVDIELETGRFHQIRAQMSIHGYPLLGDKKYGSRFPKIDLKLEAYSLTLVHPTTKEWLTFKEVKEFKDLL